MDYWMELFSAMISISCLQSRGCWFGTDEHQLMEKKNVDCNLRTYFITTKDNQWPSFVILSVWCNLISCMGFPTFVDMVSVVIVCKLSLILLFLQIVFESFSSDFVNTNKRFFCFFASPCSVIQTQIPQQTLKLLACSVRISGNTIAEFVKLWSRAGLLTEVHIRKQ